MDVNITINNTGDVHVSHYESASDSELNTADYGEGYASAVQDDRDGTISGDTEMDRVKEELFKQGWNAALRECQLNFVNDRLVEFFNEVGLKDGSEDPHHNEPVGTGEVVDETNEDRVLAAGHTDGVTTEVIMQTQDGPKTFVVPGSGWSEVDSSGEPEKENMNLTNVAVEGMRHIPEDEYQNVLDETYNRGRRDGFDEGRTRTLVTRRTLDIKLREAFGRHIDTGHEPFGVPKKFIEDFVTSLGFRVVD